jgi:adenylate cyclase
MRLIVHKFFKSFRYGLLALIVLFILDFYAHPLTFSWVNDLLAFPVGFFIGLVSEFFIGKQFRRLRYPVQVLIEIIILGGIIAGVIACVSYINDALPFSKFSKTLPSIGTSDFRELIIQFMIVALVVITLFQVERLIGRKTFLKFIFGSYDRPKEVEQIFMFIDMKDATTYAEKIGNVKFYEMVNETITDMTRATLKTDAEILKYIGDEVVFTWPLKTGLKRNNCVALFFEIEKVMLKKASYYEKKYGCVPTYKAGIHGGKVICAQMGDLRKAIDYSGDVINSTARLEGVCNENNANLVVSKFVFDQLADNSKYEGVELDKLELKGKSKELVAMKVTLA